MRSLWIILALAVGACSSAVGGSGQGQDPGQADASTGQWWPDAGFSFTDASTGQPDASGGQMTYGGDVITDQTSVANGQPMVHIVVATSYDAASCGPGAGVDSVEVWVYKSAITTGQDIPLTDAGGQAFGIHCVQNSCLQATAGSVNFDRYDDSVGASGRIYVQDDNTKVTFNSSWCTASM